VHILVLVYPTMAQVEASLLCFIAGYAGNQISTVAPAGEEQVKSLEGFTVLPDWILDPADPVAVAQYDMLVIPGGHPENIVDREDVHSLIRQFNEAGKLIGAICAGPAVLAAAGVLHGRSYTHSFGENYRGLFEEDLKKDEFVVVDGNIVTAMGHAYGQFARVMLAKAGFDTKRAGPWLPE